MNGCQNLEFPSLLDFIEIESLFGGYLKDMTKMKVGVGQGMRAT